MQRCAAPEAFAGYAPQLVEAGAAFIGGCCGTTPEHIRRLKAALEGIKPLRPVEAVPRVSSLLNAQELRVKPRPLFIGERTVRTHISNILGKLHLANRTQAALYAQREGLVHLEM